MELVNTAVERTVDLAAAGRVHPTAAMAKEVAASAVLVAALHAAGVGCYLFIWRIGLEHTLRSLSERPLLLLLPAAAAVAGLLGGRDTK